MNMTVPEYVTKYNIEKLQKFVNNGPDIYPGAKYIIKTKNGKEIKLDLNYVKKELKKFVKKNMDEFLELVDYQLEKYNKLTISHNLNKVLKNRCFVCNGWISK
jgi:DNA-directed RNA polymerase beta' subunit